MYIYVYVLKCQCFVKTNIDFPANPIAKAASPGPLVSIYKKANVKTICLGKCQNTWKRPPKYMHSASRTTTMTTTTTTTTTTTAVATASDTTANIRDLGF